MIRAHGNIRTRHGVYRIGGPGDREAVDDYPGLDHVVSRAYGAWGQGNNDTVGAAVAVVELERRGVTRCLT